MRITELPPPPAACNGGLALSDQLQASLKPSLDFDLLEGAVWKGWGEGRGKKRKQWKERGRAGGRNGKGVNGAKGELL